MGQDRVREVLMTDNWHREDPSNVRVVDGGNQPEPAAPDRNRYLRRRDEDLNEIEGLLLQARSIIEEVLIGFGMYETPKHKDLPTLIDQQIAQVVEYRRMKQ